MGQTQGFLGDVEVKNSPVNGGNTGDEVQSLGWEDSLE